MKRTMIVSLGVLVAIIAMLIATPSFPGTKLVSISQPPGDANSSTKFGTQQESPLPPPTVPADSIIDLGTYQFSEPQLIYEEKGPILIDNWLPDNRNLLFSTFLMDEENAGRVEEIKILDTTTRAAQLFGRRSSIFSRKSIWLPDVQEVVFFGADNPDKDELNTSVFQLWIAGSEKAQTLGDTSIGPIGAIAGRDHTLLALQRDTGAILEIDKQTGQTHKLPIDVKTYGLDPSNPYLQMLWHPILPLLAVFDQNGFIVVNLSTNEVRQIDLGEDNSEAYWGRRWATGAQWNPTQEQLALSIGVGNPSFHSTRLFLLDASSGKSTQISFPGRWILDMLWAPDSVQLLIRSKLDTDTREFFLVNTQSGNLLQIEELPDLKSDGLPGRNISWSPDGSKLVLCIENQLYLAQVSENH